MDFSLNDLQLNKGQATLSTAQQKQLLEVIDRILRVNYNPHRGSILIVRMWGDGTFEEILSGNLRSGKATNCCTQKYIDHPDLGPRLVHDERCDSAKFVTREVLEAVHCAPGSFYYDKLNTSAGSIYAKQGHYVLSLPLRKGRLVASFRARYCWHQNKVSVSVDEPWQHELMLLSLAEALHGIMDNDQRLADSFEEVLSLYEHRGLPGYVNNSGVIQRCLKHQRAENCQVINLANSKLIPARRAAAYA